MKHLTKPKLLPVLTLALGVLGLLLRLLLYAVALDERYLLPGGHPLSVALWLVTGAALALIITATWRLDGSSRYQDNFSPSPAAAAGHFLAAGGILITVLVNQPLMSGYLGRVWRVLGFLAPPCLAVAGIDRLRGRQPFFLLHMTACMFLVFHIVDHYQFWSGRTQLQDYIFALMGTMVLMFFSFYSAAFDVESGKRRMQLGTGLTAVYLCTVNLSTTQYPFLYLGGIAWALTDLCTLTPKPKPPESEQKNADS